MKCFKCKKQAEIIKWVDTKPYCPKCFYAASLILKRKLGIIRPVQRETLKWLKC